MYMKKEKHQYIKENINVIVCEFLAFGVVKNCLECKAIKNYVCVEKMKQYGYNKESKELEKSLDNNNMIYSKYYK